MKILVDTNIILDVLCNRKDFVENAARIFELCEEGKITGYVSALSFPNIVYVMRKELSYDRIRDILSTLSSIFTIIDLRTIDLFLATELNFKDYEDTLQCTCAARVQADFIVTRNTKDFSTSTIPAILPSDFMQFV